jgi:hypothetical protein
MSDHERINEVSNASDFSRPNVGESVRQASVRKTSYGEAHGLRTPQTRYARKINHEYVIGTNKRRD